MEQTLNHQSSTIKSTVYNFETFSLKVEYLSGNVYEYSGVDHSTYDTFLNSPSKGKGINEIIKDKFSYVKIR